MSDLDDMQLEKFQKELSDAKAELKTMEETVDSSTTEPTDLTETQETHNDTMDSEVKDQVEHTEIEQEAMKQGWNPNHKGPNAKSAEQFVRDGSFFKKIDSQNKKIETLTDTVKALLDHNRKLEEVKFKEGYNKAHEERLKAIEEGDLQAFNVAEEKLKQQAEIHKSLEQFKTENTISPEIVKELDTFKERNKDWFALNDKESQEMTKLAVAFDQYNLGNGKSQQDSIKEVEDLMRLKFPHRFENLKQEKAPAVAKSTVSSSARLDTLSAKLSEQQRWMFTQAKAIDPSMKIEEYAKQLKTIGALKDE